MNYKFNDILFHIGYNIDSNNKKEDKEYIFHDVEKVLSQKHMDKIWEMIWKRWCFLVRYAIKRNNRNKIVAILNYDEKTKTYTIDIPENVSSVETPFMMSLFLKKGIRKMDSNWSMKWVQSRIIPSSRQNIGEILRVNGMRSYDEHMLLLKNEGRCCQDEFYIEYM